MRLADQTREPNGASIDELGAPEERIVADIVREWADRHGSPFSLDLTGPGAGSYVNGAPDAGPEIEMDTVEFCRILSGRATGEGLLEQQVPF